MITVLDPGPLTSVQDSGRGGQLHLGIPPSGALDLHAHAIANRLVGNDAGAAALECTLGGPRLCAAGDCTVAVTGADVPVSVDGVQVPTWTTIVLRAGNELRVGTARSGLRGYLAFGGGIDVPVVLGSRSTYLRGHLGGFRGRMLRKGDELALCPAGPPRRLRLRPADVPRYGAEVEVRVVLGPQHERFTARGIETFLSADYAMLAQSDRMGARLHGGRIEHAAGHDIVSDGTALGSVQVPGDGQPIVLLSDRQSTGGYTKIATVCSFDIPRIAQLRPGQALRFRAVGVPQAHALLRAARIALREVILEECH